MVTKSPEVNFNIQQVVKTVKTVKTRDIERPEVRDSSDSLLLVLAEA
jgi:hypothetical protein